MPRLVHITTVPKSFLFLRDQIRYVRERGFEVSAITSPGPELARFSRELDLEILPIEMPRRISPLEDLAALGRIATALRKISPDIVHAHTPKGGLLGMMGAALAGIDHRVYHMRGLPMMTATASLFSATATAMGAWSSVPPITTSTKSNSVTKCFNIQAPEIFLHLNPWA